MRAKLFNVSSFGAPWLIEFANIVTSIGLPVSLKIFTATVLDDSRQFSTPVDITMFRTWYGCAGDVERTIRSARSNNDTTLVSR